MPPFIDISNKRFGKIIPIKPVRNGSIIYWECACDCGRKTTINSSDIRTGHTTSCGCARDEKLRSRSLTHGMSKSQEYSIWESMKTRCNNPKSINFSRYGAIGIRVCDRWMKFESFLDDVGMRPSKSHSLDRIDPFKGYEPGNVRWATEIEQQNNRRNNITIAFGNVVKTASEWAREKGIKRATLLKRIELGWPIERALGTT